MNAVNEDGNTALMLFLNEVSDYNMSSMLPLLRMLLKHNPDLNIQNQDKETALMLVLKTEFFKAASRLVQLLLEKQPDLMLKDNHGNLPLHLAVSRCQDYGRERCWNLIIDAMIQNPPRKKMTAQAFNELMENKAGRSVLYTLLESLKREGWLEEYDAFKEKYKKLEASFRSLPRKGSRHKKLRSWGHAWPS